jgi:heme oxygenase (staphylobilin-producing)
MLSRDHAQTGSSDDPEVYTVQFTFTPGEYDDEFHRLNDLIDEAAYDNPGFLGKEWWERPDGETQSVLYFWESLEALETFSQHPDHVEAKRRYEEWYDGYEIRVSKVLEQRGDGGLESH